MEIVMATPNSPFRKVAVFVTNTYPYSPGEEFIEAEVEYLARAFDRVILIPAFPYLRKGRRREVPGNFDVLVPAGLDGSRKNYMEVLRFSLRHPCETSDALVSASSEMPRFRRAMDDLKLDLFARMIVESILREISGLIRDEDEIVFYSYWMFAPARVALQLRDRLGRTGSPTISRAHGYDVFAERRASNYLPQRELLLSQLTSVFTASENGRDYLRRRYPAFAEKIHTRRLGVAGATSAGNPSREEFVVYSCAHIHPVKRIPLLIEGLSIAQRRGVPLRWIHIGGHEDIETVATMRGLAEENLEIGSFEILGNLSNAQVREQYAKRAGSVFVNTSESEGAPVSIMEALAQGMPIIATNVGGNRELISREFGMFDGLLGANPTPEEIADRLHTLASASDAEYRAFVGASLRLWSERWSSEMNYRVFTDELVRLAA